MVTPKYLTAVWLIMTFSNVHIASLVLVWEFWACVDAYMSLCCTDWAKGLLERVVDCTRLFPYKGLKPKTWRILPLLTPLVPISHIIFTDQQRSHFSDDDFPLCFFAEKAEICRHFFSRLEGSKSVAHVHVHSCSALLISFQIHCFYGIVLATPLQQMISEFQKR